MARSRTSNGSDKSSASLGFEAKLWLAADKHAMLVAGNGAYKGANPEDPDEYRAETIFWMPPAARWPYLQNSAKQPTIGNTCTALCGAGFSLPRLRHD